MLHGKGGTELGLASTAVLIHLLQRLVSQGTLPRTSALVLLGKAADELAKETGQSHQSAAELIRKEIVPHV